MAVICSKSPGTASLISMMPRLRIVSVHSTGSRITGKQKVTAQGAFPEGSCVLTRRCMRRRLKSMEFKVSELEREPIEFVLELSPGAIDFGEEAEQEGLLATEGRAEVIHE